MSETGQLTSEMLLEVTEHVRKLEQLVRDLYKELVSVNEELRERSAEDA